MFYRNILKDIDVNYQITKTPFRVKEEIILKANSKSQIPNHKQIQNSNDQNSKQENLTFFFSAETSGKPVRQPDGSIAFFGDNGDYLFQLEKPFMIDAKGERSEEVRIEIKPTSDVGLGKNITNTLKSKNPIVSNGVFDALTGAMSELVNSLKSIGEGNVLSSTM